MVCFYIQQFMTVDERCEILFPLLEETQEFLSSLTVATFFDLLGSQSLSVAFMHDYLRSYLNGRATTRSTRVRKENMEKILVESNYHQYLEEHFAKSGEEFFGFPENLHDEFVDDVIEISDDDIIVINDEEEDGEAQFVDAYNRYEPQNGGQISDEDADEENAYERMRRMWYQPAPQEFDEDLIDEF